MPEKLSRKESSELEYGGGGGSGLRGDPGGGGTNSNGTLNTLTDGGNNNNSGNQNGHGDQLETVEFSDACLTSVKAFFRNKGICGECSHLGISILPVFH